MDKLIKEITRMIKKMAKANYLILMDKLLREIGCMGKDFEMFII